MKKRLLLAVIAIAMIITAAACSQTFTVSFDLNGGSGSIDAQVVQQGNTASKPETDPTKTGYQFGGWFNGTTAYDFSTAIDSDLTLTAKWTANTYKVVFQANEGTGTMADQSFTYDEEQALTANAFAREGFTFAGWNTVAAGTGTAYANSAAVKNLTATNNGTITLYAQWTAVAVTKHTVTFIDHEGTEISSEEIAEGTTIVAPSALADYSLLDGDYTFAGWKNTVGGAVFAGTEKVEADVTFQAYFTFEAYYTVASGKITGLTTLGKTKVTGAVQIPSKVGTTTITALATSFAGDGRMTSIVVPASVALEEGCLSGATLITSLTANLGDLTLAEVYGLDSIGDLWLLESVTVLGNTFAEGAFAEAYNLTVTLSNTITAIPDGAFEDAWVMTVHIPASVTEIGENAFKDAELVKIHLYGEIPTVEANTFENAAYFLVFTQEDLSDWADQFDDASGNTLFVVSQTSVPSQDIVGEWIFSDVDVTAYIVINADGTVTLINYETDEEEPIAEYETINGTIYEYGEDWLLVVDYGRHFFVSVFSYNDVEDTITVDPDSESFTLDRATQAPEFAEPQEEEKPDVEDFAGEYIFTNSISVHTDEGPEEHLILIVYQLNSLTDVTITVTNVTLGIQKTYYGVVFDYSQYDTFVSFVIVYQTDYLALAFEDGEIASYTLPNSLIPTEGELVGEWITWVSYYQEINMEATATTITIEFDGTSDTYDYTLDSTSGIITLYNEGTLASTPVETTNDIQLAYYGGYVYALIDGTHFVFFQADNIESVPSWVSRPYQVSSGSYINYVEDDDSYSLWEQLIISTNDNNGDITYTATYITFNAGTLVLQENVAATYDYTTATFTVGTHSFEVVYSNQFRKEGVLYEESLDRVYFAINGSTTSIHTYDDQAPLQESATVGENDIEIGWVLAGEATEVTDIEDIQDVIDLQSYAIIELRVATGIFGIWENNLLGTIELVVQGTTGIAILNLTVEGATPNMIRGWTIVPSSIGNFTVNMGDLGNFTFNGTTLSWTTMGGLTFTRSATTFADQIVDKTWGIANAYAIGGDESRAELYFIQFSNTNYTVGVIDNTSEEYSSYKTAVLTVPHYARVLPQGAVPYKVNIKTREVIIEMGALGAAQFGASQLVFILDPTSGCLIATIDGDIIPFFPNDTMADAPSIPVSYLQDFNPAGTALPTVVAVGNISIEDGVLSGTLGGNSFQTNVYTFIQFQAAQDKIMDGVFLTGTVQVLAATVIHQGAAITICIVNFSADSFMELGADKENIQKTLPLGSAGINIAGNYLLMFNHTFSPATPPAGE